jgi:hypothetical protein
MSDLFICRRAPCTIMRHRDSAGKVGSKRHCAKK